MFDQKLIEQMKQHSIREYPKEACGFVFDHPDNGIEYIPCKNMSNSPEKDFSIAPEPLIPLFKRNRIKAIFHSHTDGSDFPSKRDMQAQMATDVPWGILVAHPMGCSEPFWFGDEVPVAPLLGRQFRHGVSDCYALVRDYFFCEYEFRPLDLPRDNEWWEIGQNVLLDNFKNLGFVEIPALEHSGDCFLMKLMSGTPNHCGIYVGNDRILHHLSKRLSRYDMLGPWKSRISHCMRYEG